MHMKFLKILLILIGVIIAAFLVAALVIPKDYTVERKTTITASYDVVYSQISTLNAMHDWSPWARRDSAMEITYEGEVGAVGSVYTWKSEMENLGHGKQEITAVTDSRIETKLNFISPMEREANVFVEAVQLEEGIEVTWGFKGSSPFPWNIMNPMMDKWLGADFESGLANLKEICENMPEEPKTYRGYTISEMEVEARNYIAHREVVKFEDMQNFYGTHFTATFQFATENALEFASRPSGIYFSYDEANMQADLAAGVAVQGEVAELPEGYETIAVGGKALLIEYYGPYDGVAEAHYAMDDYMKEKGLELNEIVMEEYVSDPGQEPDPSKWLTYIYYFVK